MNYLALKTNSSTPGSSLVTMMPLFILAGSSAQFEMPTNATLSAIYWKLSALLVLSLLNYICSEHAIILYKIITSLDPVVPSSSNGCNVFKGRLGESSASPTSSNTTTET